MNAAPSADPTAGACLAAAIALHFLDGYEQRLAATVERSKALLAELAQLPGCRVEELEHGTHVSDLHLQCITPDQVQTRCLEAYLYLDAAMPTETGARFSLRSNESILRKSLDQLISIFANLVAH